MSFDNFFRCDASISAMTLPPVAYVRSASSQLRIDEHRKDEEVEHSKQAVLEWMKSGEGVKTADVRPHEYTTQPTDEEGQIIESAHHMSPPSAHQDEIPIENLESREDLSDGTVMIRLEKHGIEVRIPPNEAYRAKDVIVEPIHDIPPELVLKETEAIISVGLRMSPSDATFDIPVTVTMPHCGIFTKPETAKVVTYYRKSASESFTALLSTGGSPQCVVRHRDLDIYMNHFSEIWIVAIIRRTFIGKRVICTPYIPVSAPKNDEHVLFVHVKDENIGKGEVQPGYMAPITGEQFLVRWRSGALKITCPESTMKDKAMTLRGSEIRHLTQQKVMFKVDTRTADKNKVILQFILKQSTTKQLLVPMHLEEITASPRPSASTSVNDPPQDASAEVDEVSISRARLEWLNSRFLIIFRK
ncbi:uncharacterized protein LOC105443493 [Strongylocentrotus purpuratus]|uniref:ZU5 domain-containing protein n=1 Tax=Strongylocentrotus purpuratus TaxID=7668 RepID=A0A7M7PCB2_STRPU|nr:uncharacterized protein LOC105443493 [Strongylocentrotus purpuratus]